jgi:hypothetical protein
MSDFKHCFGVAPSDQNALDLFTGEWSSRLPADRPDLKAGTTALFDDQRIAWAHRQLGDLGLEGGFAGREVLELGPLEGGHSYLIDRLGARQITAIEANARAYLKCLIAKEVLGMPRVRFQFGDALVHLRTPGARYDIAVACGILYHLVNPVELFELLAARCDALFLWTVFYDPEFVARNPVPGAKFSEAIAMEHDGFRHTVHRFDYGPALDWKGFCGGGDSFSYWMEKPEILAALARYGFTEVRTEHEPNVHGSALMLAARQGTVG